MVQLIHALLHPTPWPLQASWVFSLAPDEWFLGVDASEGPSHVEMGLPTLVDMFRDRVTRTRDASQGAVHAALQRPSLWGSEVLRQEAGL